MKKFLVAAVASVVLFGGQAGLEALPVDSSDTSATQWTKAYYRDGDDYEGHDRERHHDDGDDWRHNPRHDDGDDYRHEPPAHQGDDDYRHEPPAHHDGENPTPHRGGYQDYGY